MRITSPADSPETRRAILTPGPSSVEGGPRLALLTPPGTTAAFSTRPAPGVHLRFAVSMEAGLRTERIPERAISERPQFVEWLRESDGMRFEVWIEEHRDEQVFAYVHSMEPHEPYEPIEAFRRRVEVPPYDGPFDGGSDALNRITRSVLSGFDLTDENEPITWADIEYLESLYLAEVAQWDFIFGSLLLRMRREGLQEHTAIVVTGDHGEEFLEHGSLRHCRTLYEEVLEVPLLISYPARIPAGRVKQPVPWSALARTICDLAGAPPPPGAQGPSLLDVASGKAHAGPIVSSTSLGRNVGDPRLRAIESIREEDLKLIWWEGERAASLFDLASDPAERHDLLGPWLGGNPQGERDGATDPRLRRLLEELRAIRGSAGDLMTESVSGMDPEMREAFEALGYVR